MGKSTGFMEYERQTSKEVPPLERIKNFNEFHEPLSMEEQRKQAARCMDCGVPFCQYGYTGHQVGHKFLFRVVFQR